MSVIAMLRSGHAVDLQQMPELYRPRWHVGHLVYKGGNPDLKRSSLTGGGFIPDRDLAGREAPSWHAYATITQALAGAGFVASRPNFLTALGGGAQQTTQF